VLTDQARDLAGAVTFARSTPGCHGGTLAVPSLESAGPGLSVAKTERIRRQSRSETSWRAAETKKARKRAVQVDQI
jgi:hypothetical protein